jgi:hypothetical protein
LRHSPETARSHITPKWQTDTHDQHTATAVGETVLEATTVATEEMTTKMARDGTGHGRQETAWSALIVASAITRMIASCGMTRTGGLVEMRPDTGMTPGIGQETAAGRNATERTVGRTVAAAKIVV